MAPRPLQDKNLKFNAKNHTYKIGTTELRSVTAWLKEFFAPFDEKTVSQFVARNRQAKGEKITAAQVRKEWKKIAEEGTAVHKDIELFIRGKTDELDLQNVRSLAGTAAYKRLCNTYPEARPTPELRIYSEGLRLAGTIDLLLLNPDGTAIIVDWKTNRKLSGDGKLTKHPAVAGLIDANLVRYQLQLSIYAYILEREHGIKVKKLVIVHLTETEAKEIVVENLRDIVEQMVKHEN